MRATTSSSVHLRKPCELLHHLLVDLALERDDQRGQLLHPLPPPFHELGLVAAGRMRNVDLAFIADEAHRKPFLRLAAVLALPRLTDDVGWDVVSEPVLDLA